MGSDKYSCFGALAAAEQYGLDYDIEARLRKSSSVLIMALHGGKIEPYTDTIADAIAGNDFSFYCC